MIFRPELVEKVMYGGKVETRRPTKGKPCRYAVGQDYAVQPGRGQGAVGRIRILAVQLTVLGGLGEHAAWREGFRSSADFYAYWMGLYGTVDYDAPVYAITFEVVERNAVRLRRAAASACATSRADGDPQTAVNGAKPGHKQGLGETR